MTFTAQQQQVYDLLVSQGVPEPDGVMASLAQYHQLLLEYNPQVNLVSRKTSPDDYWLYHFLDSILALKCLDFKKKTVLDFGSGGGIPGIPIRLAIPQVRLFLLDATRKKCVVMRQMLSELNLSDCRVVNKRLEDYAQDRNSPRFDLILCRAVALEPRYIQPLHSLLRRQGRVILYKAHRLDDVSDIRHRIIMDEDVPNLGYRRLIAIERSDLAGLSTSNAH